MSLLTLTVAALVFSGIGFVIERTSHRGIRGPLSLVAIEQCPRPWSRYLAGRVSRVSVRRAGAEGFELVIMDMLGNEHILARGTNYDQLAQTRGWLCELVGICETLDS